MPCVRGNRLSTEERTRLLKEAREAREAVYASPEYKYWTALVAKVYDEPNGFAKLPHPERLYYLVNVFSGEVHNGGFDQFFTNSSGAHYADTVAALEEVGARQSLSLLLEAKAILFASNDVPVDRTARCEMMPTWEEAHPDYDTAHEALNSVDKRFYADPDNLGQTLENLAHTNGLYASDL